MLAGLLEVSVRARVRLSRLVRLTGEKDWGDFNVELLKVRYECDVEEEEGGRHAPLSKRAHQVGVITLKYKPNICHCLFLVHA